MKAPFSHLPSFNRRSSLSRLCQHRIKHGGSLIGGITIKPNFTSRFVFVFAAMAIDNSNFQRILANFPVVRLRDFNLEEELAAQAISRSLENRMVQRRQSRKEKDTNYHSVDQNAAFWVKLKSSAEEKLGSAEAEAFCKAFQEVYRTLVFEELSAEAAQKFINSA